MTTLIIILPDDAAVPAGSPAAAMAGTSSPGASLLVDYLVTPDGATVSRQSQAALSLLATVAHDDVVVVVPVRRLSWQVVQLPKGTLARSVMAQGDSPRLRAVLESLIEEQVLDEPTELHLALSPLARESEPVTVAVCDRQWLKAWLQALEQHHLTVGRVVPEFAPNTGSPLQVMGTVEQPWVVWSPNPPSAKPGEAGAPSLVTMPLDQSTADLIQWPVGREVSAEPAVAQLAEQLFARPVTLLQQNQRWLNATDSSWDLGQFDLASSPGSRRWRKVSKAASDLWRAPRWRPARWAVVGLLLVQVLGLNAWAWVQNSRLAVHKQAVREILVQTFPNVKYVVDAPLQMRKELINLRQNSGYPSPGDFDALLAVVANLPGAGETGAPLAIDYNGQSLRVKGLQLSANQLTEANNKLKSAGIEVSVRSDELVLQVKTK
jgi:general secretion pathway protein L